MSFLKGFSASDFITTNQGGKNYIKPGVHVVQVEGKFGKSAQKGTPYVEFVYTTEDGAVNEHINYITDKTFVNLMKTVSSLALSAGKKDELIAATQKNFKDEQDWVETVVSVLNGSSLAVAFLTEEYVNKDAEVKTKSTFWFAGPVGDVENMKEYVAKNPNKAVKKVNDGNATVATVDAFAVPQRVADPFATPTTAADPFGVPANPVSSASPTVDPSGALLDANGNLLF